MAERAPLLPEKIEGLPSPTFTYAIHTSEGKRPQAIAHRGYKAAHPENTMGAFRGAVEVGAHAIETDVHITKDGVVVLSHDPTLKRCFGQDKKIIDCDWSYIKTLRTIQEPHEAMPRLKDLLEYLATPGLEEIWVLLDIKVPITSWLLKPFKSIRRINRRAQLDNAVDGIFKLIAEVISEVEPSRPWNKRILLGCWAASQLQSCMNHLPCFPITHIGFSTSYARQFLKVPGVSFNMLRKIMVGPFGNRFLRDVKKANRSIFVWTVNDEAWMKWAISKEFDGVLTDDPKKYLEVRDSYVAKKHRIPLKSWGAVFFMNILAFVFSLLFRYRYGFSIKASAIRASLDSENVVPVRRQ